MPRKHRVFPKHLRNQHKALKVEHGLLRGGSQIMWKEIKPDSFWVRFLKFFGYWRNK